MNAAVRCETGLAPDDLLDWLKGIETRFGRVADARWSARPLDIDILAMDDLIYPDTSVFQEWLTLDPDAQKSKAPDRLVIPHPRIQDRAFVLIPMLDVAPDWRHPILGLTVADMLGAIPLAEQQAVTPV